MTMAHAPTDPGDKTDTTAKGNDQVATPAAGARHAADRRVDSEAVAEVRGKVGTAEAAEAAIDSVADARWARPAADLADVPADARVDRGAMTDLGSRSLNGAPSHRSQTSSTRMTRS
jgi:hypothetical protein